MLGKLLWTREDNIVVEVSSSLFAYDEAILNGFRNELRKRHGLDFQDHKASWNYLSRERIEIDYGG